MGTYSQDVELMESTDTKLKNLFKDGYPGEVETKQNRNTSNLFFNTIFLFCGKMRLDKINEDKQTPRSCNVCSTLLIVRSPAEELADCTNCSRAYDLK